MTSFQVETKKGKIEYTKIGNGKPILFIIGGHTNCHEKIFYKGLDVERYCFIIPSRPGSLRYNINKWKPYSQRI